MSSLVSCLQVRSQLADQLLEYLEKVQDYADTRLMPGRDERMPMYFDDADMRNPTGGLPVAGRCQTGQARATL